MSIFIILVLILTGLFLLVLEFFVFPGVTISGIGGVLLIGIGLFSMYKGYGNVAGHLSVVSTLVLGILILYLSVRKKTWDKMSLGTSIDSKIETVSDLTIHVGDRGVAISRLNPMGKAKVNNEIIEAHCPGHFVDEDKEVEVVKVYKTYIVVKQV